MPHLSKPGIDRLLVRSALEADLRRRLLESPEEVFQEFDLTEEQQDLLRRPDHRLLPLLGSVLARQAESADESGPPAGKDRDENGRLVAPAVLPPVTGPAPRSPALPDPSSVFSRVCATLRQPQFLDGRSGAAQVR